MIFIIGQIFENPIFKFQFSRKHNMKECIRPIPTLNLLSSQIFYIEQPYQQRSVLFANTGIISVDEVEFSTRPQDN